MPDVKPYLIYGPARYQDEHWNILLLTLNYHGQLIDINGANDCFIFNNKTNQWIQCEANFSTVIKSNINNMDISIIAKEDLIKYKSELKRKEDLADLKELANSKIIRYP